MESAKVKNLIITALVIVNLFFLALVISDNARESAARKSSLTEAMAVLEQRGITVARGADLGSSELDVLTVERDMKAEQRHIEALLGDVTASNQGGNIVSYAGRNGQAVFRGSGGFEMLFNESVIPMGKDAEKTARSTAAKLGIAVARGSGSARVDVNDSGGTVELQCAVNGVRIIGCSMTFTFNNGSLILLGGTRPLDRVGSDSAADTFDVPTVLMRFLETVTAEGRVCSEVRDVEMCYVLNSAASGKGLLIPVWRIETDAGDVYINGLTGKQETAS